MLGVQLVVHKYSLWGELVSDLFCSLKVLTRYPIEEISVLVDHCRLWAFAKTCLLADCLHKLFLLGLGMSCRGSNQIVLCNSTLLHRRIVLAELRCLVIEDETLILRNPSSCSLIWAQFQLCLEVLSTFFGKLDRFGESILNFSLILPLLLIWLNRF
jgi:hypothetical protein